MHGAAGRRLYQSRPGVGSFVGSAVGDEQRGRRQGAEAKAQAQSDAVVGSSDVVGKEPTRRGGVCVPSRRQQSAVARGACGNRAQTTRNVTFLTALCGTPSRPSGRSASNDELRRAAVVAKVLCLAPEILEHTGGVQLPVLRLHRVHPQQDALDLAFQGIHATRGHEPSQLVAQSGYRHDGARMGSDAAERAD